MCPVTLINVFEVAPEHLDEFVASWRERAAIMSRQPGFRDSRLHRATGDARFQLVNVAHWDSQEALQAATANPEFQEAIQALGQRSDIDFSANPAVYREVVVVDGPQD